MTNTIRLTTDKRLVGWREWVGMPDWGVPRVLAKIDTGARTSALHVDNIRRLPQGRVGFEVVLSRHNARRRIGVEAPLRRVSRVKPSSGQTQERLVVQVDALIGDFLKRIEVSLVSRQAMICRMLLGRSALEGDFLVDASRRFVQGKPKAPPSG